MRRSIHEINSRNQKGFSLVELLIVIAIIAILAAIAVPAFSRYRISAAKSACQADARNCVSICALEFSGTNAIIPNCGCNVSPGSTATIASIDAAGVISVRIDCNTAYVGNCQFDNATGQIVCS